MRGNGFNTPPNEQSKEEFSNAQNTNIYFPLLAEANAFPQGKEVEVILIGKRWGSSSLRTRLYKGASGASDITTYADDTEGDTIVTRKSNKTNTSATIRNNTFLL